MSWSWSYDFDILVLVSVLDGTVLLTSLTKMSKCALQLGHKNRKPR